MHTANSRRTRAVTKTITYAMLKANRETVNMTTRNSEGGESFHGLKTASIVFGNARLTNGTRIKTDTYGTVRHDFITLGPARASPERHVVCSYAQNIRQSSRSIAILTVLSVVSFQV